MVRALRLLIVLVAVGSAGQAAALAVDSPRPWIRVLLEGDALAVAGSDLDLPALRTVYAATGHAPLWDDIDVARVLEAAGREGLDPAAYPMRYRPPAGMSAMEARARRDLLLTNAVLLYARHLRLGRVDPAAVDSLWTLPRPEFDAAEHLAAAAADGGLVEALLALPPPHAQYRRLRGALARAHRQAAADPDAAVRRIRRIEAAMERWRWVPPLPARRVEVNTAAFRMTAYDDDRPRLDMRVVVGAPAAPTPAFTKAITAVVLNPDWTLPRSIAVAEYLPRIQENPGFLAANDIRVVEAPPDLANATEIDWSRYGAGNFPFWLRQAPGPDNPLGRIKFEMPGGNAIYLHDTPEKDKFDFDRRAFSHGCVRLEDPMALAMMLLGEDGWTPARLAEAIAGGETRRLRAPRPMPVYAFHMPVSVADDGTVRFHDDPYHREGLLLRALER